MTSYKQLFVLLLAVAEAQVDVLPRHGVNFAFWVKLDCCTFQALERHHSSSVEIFYVGILSCLKLLLSEIPFVFETPKWLCELENVTKASIDIVESSKWVKFNFSVNYPFKKNIKN